MSHMFKNTPNEFIQVEIHYFEKGYIFSHDHEVWDYTWYTLDGELTSPEDIWGEDYPSESRDLVSLMPACYVELSFPWAGARPMYMNTAMQEERYNIGQDSIVEAFCKDLIPKGANWVKEIRKKHNSDWNVASFLTAWEYQCWQSNHPLDPVEWDCEWQYLGEAELMLKVQKPDA